MFEYDTIFVSYSSRCAFITSEKQLEINKGNILIIDDDYDVLKSAQLFLRRFFRNVFIEQVIINLISNSIDALSGVLKPVIRFCAKMEGNHSVIEIKDNGKGILPEQLEQIFVPFYSTKQKGNGIGLSFSRQIMKLHGGSISVKSEPGKETGFTLKF